MNGNKMMIGEILWGHDWPHVH